MDELARCGLRDACTSPGSRSTPILLSLLREPRVRCHSHIDERAAGFFALGIAKASARPAAVSCTSGTAAAELLPAVAEAREARVPLIVLSADRPPELREVGAGQTIDQVKLYGDAAKWFFEVDSHAATPARVRWTRTLACRAFATALEGRPGPVHINFTLREPLVIVGPVPGDDSARPGGAPFLRRAHVVPATHSPELLALVAHARRGVVVAGRHERPAPLGRAAAAFASALGWPLLADPLSGARRGTAAVAYYDALLRDHEVAGELVPDLVLRVGDLPTSKSLRAWLAGLPETAQVSFDPEGAWQDPDSVCCLSLDAEPAGALSALAGAGLSGAPSGWLGRWHELDAGAARVLGAAFADDGLTEPRVAHELGRLLPERATLFVASSMPVRDVESFWSARDDPPRVLSNRGANGIDGTVSSALGVAAVSDGPVVLLIGDVTLAHDIGGLVGAGRLPANLTIVLLNNGGGGVFDFLAVASAPMARHPDVYGEHIATPPGIDFAVAARLAGVDHERPEGAAGFVASVGRALEGGRTTIIEVQTVRQENVLLHRRLWSAVTAAVGASGPQADGPLSRRAPAAGPRA